MSKKPASRLGRGLSSLLSIPSLEETRLSSSEALPEFSEVELPAETPETRVIRIAVEQIRSNPHQPRRSFDEQSLQQLAESLKSTGLIQPIIVRPLDTGFELIAGERRLRAARLAGFPEIPALVREVGSAEQAEFALIENVQREDLNPIDRARAYRELMNRGGMTQHQIAARLGEDRSTIANHVRLLDLAQPVQDGIRDGAISLGHAKLLAGLPDLLQQQALGQRIIVEQLSVRKLEQLLTVSPETPGPVKADLHAHIADLETQIAQQLGLRVQVRRGGKGKGRVVIHYGSLDQFDDLLNRLSVRIHPA